MPAQVQKMLNKATNPSTLPAQSISLYWSAARTLWSKGFMQYTATTLVSLIQLLQCGQVFSGISATQTKETHSLCLLALARLMAPFYPSEAVELYWSSVERRIISDGVNVGDMQNLVNIIVEDSSPRTILDECHRLASLFSLFKSDDAGVSTPTSKGIRVRTVSVEFNEFLLAVPGSCHSKVVYAVYTTLALLSISVSISCNLYGDALVQFKRLGSAVGILPTSEWLLDQARGKQWTEAAALSLLWSIRGGDKVKTSRFSHCITLFVPMRTNAVLTFLLQLAHAWITLDYDWILNEGCIAYECCILDGAQLDDWGTISEVWIQMKNNILS